MFDSVKTKQMCTCGSCKTLLYQVHAHRSAIYNCYVEKCRSENLANFCKLQNIFVSGQKQSGSCYCITQHTAASVSEQHARNAAGVVYSPTSSHFINMNEAVQRRIFKLFDSVEPCNISDNMQCNNCNPELSETSGPENETLLSNYTSETHGSNSSIVSDANKSKIINKIFFAQNKKNVTEKSKPGVPCNSSRNMVILPAGGTNRDNALGDVQMNDCVDQNTVHQNKSEFSTLNGNYLQNNGQLNHVSGNFSRAGETFVHEALQHVQQSRPPPPHGSHQDRSNMPYQRFSNIGGNGFRIPYRVLS